MASVWLARVEGKFGFEKLVAVKMILPTLASDDRFVQMFLDEARIASRIEHASVAQILDLGEQHRTLYLAMEWVDGDPLSRLHRAAQKKGIMVPPGVVLRIMSEACSGLHAAHELRGEDGALLHVVHRDVSPQNILVSTRGAAKLIDFGIAKARDRLAPETAAGLLKGKVRYMAPEQALGRRVDRRVDLWAVGATLYHLLSGTAPFEGENELVTLNRLTSGQPPPPLPESVHPAVAGVVMRSLNNNPEERYATAADMARAIDAAAIEAGLMASTGAVAAFAEEHLAARAEKRKATVAAALAAAAERRRVKQMLTPMSEITNISKIGGSGPAAPPSSSTDVTSPRLLATAPVVRTASEPLFASVTSNGSLGLPLSPLPRRAGMIAGAAVVLLALLFITLELRSTPSPAPIPARAPTRPSTEASPLRLPTLVSAIPTLPAVPVMSLPAAETFSAQRPPPAPRASPPRPLPASPRAAASASLPPPPATARARARQDDGF